MALNKSQTITDMIEEVYEHETAMKGWDSTFIESIRDFYYDKDGISDKQLIILQGKYDRLQDSYKPVTRNY